MIYEVEETVRRRLCCRLVAFLTCGNLCIPTPGGSKIPLMCLNKFPPFKPISTASRTFCFMSSFLCWPVPRETKAETVAAKSLLRLPLSTESPYMRGKFIFFTIEPSHGIKFLHHGVQLWFTHLDATRRFYSFVGFVLLCYFISNRLRTLCFAGIFILFVTYYI